MFVVVAEFDIDWELFDGVVGIFVLLLFVAWCRLIRLLNVSIEVLNDTGDWDCECCCCCCWDELYPFGIDDVEYWVW